MSVLMQEMLDDMIAESMSVLMQEMLDDMIATSSIAWFLRWCVDENAKQASMASSHRKGFVEGHTFAEYMNGNA